MKGGLKGFDHIAGLYDILARIVFGEHIVHAQHYFLKDIADGSKVLILGGGTGWLLAELLSRNPNAEVWYVEASQQMIALSREKINDKGNVHFIHGTEQDIPAEISVDMVITNFYLDLFSSEALAKILPEITTRMKENTRWIATDFVYQGKWWQSALLQIMYWFFRTVGAIESTRLPLWQAALRQAGWIPVKEKMFFRGFIKTAVYKRYSAT
jgi:ubiquinone/menaquinone biosynthesis C-methylase UbiE